MKKKTQVLLVHGAMTFKSDKDYVQYLKTRPVSLEKRISWSGEYLDKKLGRGFEVIRPQMPLKENARYRDWQIVFERYLPLLGKDFILIGNSLGGIFLAQYLSQHKLTQKARSVYLVCAPFDDSDSVEDVAGGFELGKDLSLLEKNTKSLHLLFSADDEVVPVSHAEKFRQKLKDAHIVVYKNKNGHFKVPTFPEIVKSIKEDLR
jgi:predicted alpha/beta hydrolase family esterase